MDSNKSKIEKVVAIAHTALMACINHTLPTSSVLHSLARDMAESTPGLIHILHAFLDNDLQLVDMGLEVDVVLDLVSEYIILIFDKYANEMQQIMQFSNTISKADYIAQVVWANMKLYQDMALITI